MDNIVRKLKQMVTGRYNAGDIVYEFDGIEITIVDKMAVIKRENSVWDDMVLVMSNETVDLTVVELDDYVLEIECTHREDGEDLILKYVGNLYEKNAMVVSL